MKPSLVERETILLYNQAEPMAEVYTHDPRLMEKLELLANLVANIYPVLQITA